jgi:hypothetical protein
MQISKLEMRILIAIAVVVVGILAVVIVPRLVGSAPAAPTAVGASAAAPAPSSLLVPTVTPSVAPAPTPAPKAKTEQQILDNIVASTVSVYSVLVCNSLEEYAARSIPEIITKVLAQYPTSGLSDQSRQIMAERVLTESAAKSCADQSPRVAAGIQR